MIVPGYPDRIIPKPAFEKELKPRTLTNLHNARSAWLTHAHQTLDAAVARAYGWDDYTPEMSETDILHRLLALNLTCTSGTGDHRKPVTAGQAASRLAASRGRLPLTHVYSPA